MVDPLADKLLMFCTYLILTWLLKIPVWLFLIVFARDLLITSGVFIYRHFIEEPDFHARTLSKINTVLQLGLVSLLLFDEAFLPLPNQLILFVMYLVAFTTITSFIDYCWIWGKRAREVIKQKASI